MKIVIAGIGEIGYHLAKMLSKDIHNVTLIDKDKEKLDFASKNLDILTFQGSSSLISTLKGANVEGADLLIAVTNMEEVNILTAIVGKRLGVKRTIARVSSQELFSNKGASFFTDLGIDRFIYPEHIAAHEILHLLDNSATIDSFDFSDNLTSLIAFRIDKNAHILNKNLIEIVDELEGFNFRIVAIKRNQSTIIPRGKEVIKENDCIYAIVRKEYKEELLKYSGKEKIKIEKIMILGGSRISKITAQALEDKYDVSLILNKKEKAYEFADFMPKTTIYNSEYRNLDFLEEIGLTEVDAFIALSDHTEYNIFACMFAAKLGVPKKIALINNIEYMDTIQNIGIDTIINKKLLSASNIYASTMNASVTKIKILNSIDAEFLEFEVKKGAKITKKMIKDLKLPKGVIIGAVESENGSYIAVGSTKINPGDKVIVFLLPEYVHELEKLFK